MAEIPKDILDDLCSRFIINVPEEERTDLVRLCFQVELAHWFFVDMYCSDTPECKDMSNMKFKEFAFAVFRHVPFLRQHLGRLHILLDDWKGYKQAVPTYGAILLDETLTHALLVQGFGPRASWGFPKGKVNEGEDPLRCAIREVDEEIGYNCEALIDPNEFIEHIYNDQVTRLYIVPHVPYKTTFASKTKCEIRSIRWHAIADIPTNRKDMDLQKKSGGSYYLVVPFMRKLHTWISNYTRKGSQRPIRCRNRSVSASDSFHFKSGLLGEAPFVQDFTGSPLSGFAKKAVTPAVEGERFRDTRQQHRGSPPVKRGQIGPQTPAKSAGKKTAVQQLGEQSKPKAVGGRGRNLESSLQKSSSVPGIEPFFCAAPSWATFRFDQNAILKCFDF